MEPIYQSLTERALALKSKIDSDTNQNRVVVILAGPPGSGKSMIAQHVVERLNSTCATPFASVVPMDGFHLPLSTLDRMPNRSEAYARRGSSWTFDAAGVSNLVQTLSKSRFKSPDKTETILAPSFDHTAKDPVENGIVIGPHIKFVLLEGNYLLMDEEPWRNIRELVDESWFVDVEPELARIRIAKRHVRARIEKTMDAAYRRAEGNDLLNGVEIRRKLRKPDVLVQSVEETA
ncbi:putative kinase [Cadophora gregata]|uniref:putative kinase n=1 Tax=Cadophora gregata TaxID=51156 RepID=UPI0026DD2028|nr:putative kinase [Cadophora gregata]KAK0109942.1 putative kinase [Cadophora gregata]KAK0110430.1 putative kinase [Cadophora gregata f. sp. sojae]